ncbi:DUF2238 domain-containing protein, partial [Motilimonas sp. 1_MG-2023]|nr:DUF2238 domain-containing protein [Motilimonas sp. 1_MG-2023]
MKHLWAFTFLAFLLWSGIEPKDQFTLFLEVLPANIGAVLVAATYQSF